MPGNRPFQSSGFPCGKQSAYRWGQGRLRKTLSGWFSPKALRSPGELSDLLHAISTFLRSLRSTGVTRFQRYYGRSDSCRAIVSRRASVGSLRVAPTRTHGRAVWIWSALHHLFPSRFVLSRQVSLFIALDLPTIPPSTTLCHFPITAFARYFRRMGCRVYPPGQTSWGRAERRHAIKGSPLASRLPDRLGRIRFVILRTGRSPPVASHPSSRRRSYCQLQVRNVNLVGTSTPPINRLQRRTSPVSPRPDCEPRRVSPTCRRREPPWGLGRSPSARQNEVLR